MGASEVVQIASEGFSYQIGSGAVFALGDKVNLFEHGRGQGDQDLLRHTQFLTETIGDHGTISDFCSWSQHSRFFTELKTAEVEVGFINHAQ